MTTLTLLSLLLAAAYVLAAAIVRWRAAVHGGSAARSFASHLNAALPDSLSALVYLLPAGRWRWLWSAWLAVVTLLVAPALTAATAAAWWTSLLADATIVGLAMTAALPLLPGYHNRLHNALGIAAGVLSQVCVAVVSPWWLLLWLLAPAVAIDAWFVHPHIARWYDGKGVFIAEVVCALSLYGSLQTFNF